MAEAPWIRFFASDFLTGVADLEADERGVYMTILALIFDKGAPIDDDPSWLGRRCGCSTRRFNQIRARLIADRKLESRAGLLGNRRALEEVKRRDDKSNKARHAALARWYRGDEPELDLAGEENAKPPIISGKSGEKTQEQIDLISRKKTEKPQKSAIPADATASRLAGAREELELEIDSKDSPTANPSNRASAGAVDADDDRGWDLLALTNRIAKAGGVSLHRERTRSDALDLVKGWLAQGIEVEQVIMPAIAKALDATRETSIGSLAFYAGPVAKAHAQHLRKPKPKARAQVPDPIFEFEDEDKRFAPFRRELFGELGGAAYAQFAHKARFRSEQGGGARKGQRILRVVEATASFASLRLMDGGRIAIVNRIAKAHGFAEVW